MHCHRSREPLMRDGAKTMMVGASSSRVSLRLSVIPRLFFLLCAVLLSRCPVPCLGIDPAMFSWYIPAAEYQRISGMEEAESLYLIRENSIELQQLELPPLAAESQVSFKWEVEARESSGILYMLVNTTNSSAFSAVLEGVQEQGVVEDKDFQFVFKCHQQGHFSAKVNFTIFKVIATEPSSLSGQSVVFLAERECTCQEDCESLSPTEEPPDDDQLFFIAIGVFGGFVGLMVLATVGYYSCSFGIKYSRRRAEEIELQNVQLEDVIGTTGHLLTAPPPAYTSDPSPYPNCPILPLDSVHPLPPQLHITQLTNSPRNSRTLSIPSDLGKSVRSLHAFKDLFVNRKRISVGQVLKEGVFGVVCEGYLSNAEDDVEGALPVLIKTIKSDTDERVVQSMMDGGSITRGVVHRHIVSLLAVHVNEMEQPMLLYPKPTFGSLKDLLLVSRDRKPGMGKLSSQDLVFMAGQVSRGMYHMSKKGLLHKDLSARNIYVYDNLHIRVGERALTWDFYPNEYTQLSTGEMLSVRWQAAEVLAEQRYSRFSDVWSFGVVLWEVMTLGKQPYEEIPAEEMLSILKSGHRLQQPKNCPDELFVLMGWCWALTPSERPHFSHLTIRLKEFHEKISAFI